MPLGAEEVQVTFVCPLYLSAHCVLLAVIIHPFQKSGQTETYTKWDLLLSGVHHPRGTVYRENLPQVGQMGWILCGKALLAEKCPKCCLLNSVELLYLSGGLSLAVWIEEEVSLCSPMMLVRKGGFLQECSRCGTFLSLGAVDDTIFSLLAAWNLLFSLLQERRPWPCTWTKAASTESQETPPRALKLCTSSPPPTL